MVTENKQGMRFPSRPYTIDWRRPHTSVRDIAGEEDDKVRPPWVFGEANHGSSRLKIPNGAYSEETHCIATLNNRIATPRTKLHREFFLSCRLTAKRPSLYLVHGLKASMYVVTSGNIEQVVS